MTSTDRQSAHASTTGSALLLPTSSSRSVLTAAALALAFAGRAEAQLPRPGVRSGKAAAPASDSRIVPADVRTPRASSKGGVWTLEVPRAMAAALTEWDDSFRPFGPRAYDEDLRETMRSAPGFLPWTALTLDVNGDHEPDLVVRGHTNRQTGMAAILSGPSGYRVTLLQPEPWSGRLERPLGQYILVREGPEFTTCEGDTIRALGDFIGLQTPDKGGPNLHYLATGGWRSVYAGC